MHNIYKSVVNICVYMMYFKDLYFVYIYIYMCVYVYIPVICKQVIHNLYLYYNYFEQMGKVRRYATALLGRSMPRDYCGAIAATEIANLLYNI